MLIIFWSVLTVYMPMIIFESSVNAIVTDLLVRT